MSTDYFLDQFGISSWTRNRSLTAIEKNILESGEGTTGIIFGHRGTRLQLQKWPG
jgi:hypothetical protein